MDSSELKHLLKTEFEHVKPFMNPDQKKLLEATFQSLEKAIDTYLSEQVVAGIQHPHPRSRIYRSEPNGWNILDVKAEPLFEIILQKNKDSQTQIKTKTACVFDLDGTLFDTSYRTLGIIQEWLKSAQAQTYPATLVKKIEKINLGHMGYSLAHAFENAGFHMSDQVVAEVFSALEQKWKRRFFENDTPVKYDMLIKNSIEFVSKIYNQNIAIFYVTGRYSDRMLSGTLEQLEKWGFPFQEENVILKHPFYLEDHIYKAEVMRKISANYTVIANFENEYINLISMAKEAPESLSVIVDSHHSGRPTPQMSFQDKVFRIENFEQITQT